MTMQRARWLFEPQHREHCFGRITHIGAEARRLAIRDQEQPLELERMVDPDRARMAHRRLDRGPERRKAILAEREGVERRQAPILTLRRQRIGRRTDGQTQAELLRARTRSPNQRDRRRPQGRNRGRYPSPPSGRVLPRLGAARRRSIAARRESRSGPPRHW